MKVTRRLSAVLAAGVLFIGLTSTSAEARSRTFYDGTGDTDAPSDVTRVTVNNATDTNRVIVGAEMGSMIAGDSATLWLDTRPSNAGPEYKMAIHPQSDGFYLRRVGSFADKGRKVSCPNRSAHLLISRQAVARFSIPRTCMNGPGSVRASVRGRYLYASRVVTDWAPRYHGFFDWVARG